MSYADSQAFGFAALFGMVQDLNLYSASFVDGQLVLDLSKYQLSSGISAIGGAVVSLEQNPNVNMVDADRVQSFRRGNIYFCSQRSFSRLVGYMAVVSSTLEFWPY